jgi:hypothetical protein
VTSVGGEPLVPPPREKRRRKPKTADGDKPKEGAAPKAKSPREPPFHAVLSEEIKAEIAAKGLQMVRNTVDLAIGDARIKLGQGGYASLVEKSGIVGEGSFVCDEAGQVVFTWERCLQMANGAWQVGDVSQLMSSLSLTQDAVEAVQPDETPEILWGADTPDPKDLFPENGFKMKKVILSRPRPAFPRRGGGD